jgi:hypothetical protein
VKKTDTKDPLIAASNALGFQARQLRRAAEAGTDADAGTEATTDALLKTFHQIGRDDQAGEARARAEAEASISATVQPLIARAERVLEDSKKSVAAHQAQIKRLAALPFDSIRKHIKNRITPGSAHDTMSRVNLLQRTVAEAYEILTNANDGELEAALRRVKNLDALDSVDAQRLVAELHHAARGSRGQTIEEKAGAVKRLLDELAADFASGEGAPVPAPVPAPAEPLEVAAVSPLFWATTEESGVALPPAVKPAVSEVK